VWATSEFQSAQGSRRLGLGEPSMRGGQASCTAARNSNWGVGSIALPHCRQRYRDELDVRVAPAVRGALAEDQLPQLSLYVNYV
jgi:hypothetical protein